MAVMKVAILGMVVSCLVALGSCACNFRAKEVKINRQVGGSSSIVLGSCLDEDDTVRKDGDSWRTKSCMRCSCLDDGVRCCDMAFRPTGGFSSDCEPILDKEKCVYTVVKKRNHKVKCRLSGPRGAVGK